MRRKKLWKRIEQHLVEDWRRWHKWSSVRWSLLLLGLAELQEVLPSLREYLPAGWVKYLAVAIIVGRLLRPRVPPPSQTG